MIESTFLSILYLFQIEQKSKWTEEGAVKKLKHNIEPKTAYNWQKHGNDKDNYWQKSGRRLSEELKHGYFDARRKNFEIRNLTDNELNFLLEYVCNT